MDFLRLKYTGRGQYGRCVNLPADEESRVSSAKTRRGHRCTLFEYAVPTFLDESIANSQRDCKGDGFSFVDANRFPQSFNDKASSYRCDRN